MEPRKKRMRAALKAVVLVLFIITAVLLVRFTPAKEFLTGVRDVILACEAKG